MAWVVHHGCSLDVLKTVQSDSVDSVVTDAPYGLAFMNKHWDYDVPSVELWCEVFRVLKPGGHLLSFGGTRTYHRMAVAIEDAGFEIRDQIQWLYGSGFPKSLDVSKAIDKAAGAEREVLGKKQFADGSSARRTMRYGSNAYTESVTRGENNVVTAPSTAAAKQWQGWGSALKPAHEPIVVARKPFDGPLYKNVLKHGTGGLNIDASRVATDEKLGGSGSPPLRYGGQNARPFHDTAVAIGPNQHAAGRFPANVILSCSCEFEPDQMRLVHDDDCPVAMLDRQSGIGRSGKVGIRTSDGFNGNIYGKGMGIKAGEPNGEYGDSGGASRFFYCAKASKAERNRGLDAYEHIKSDVLCKDVATVAVQLLQRVISDQTVRWSTGECGNRITVLFPKECKSIIVTAINKTIESKTWNFLAHSITSASTQDVSNAVDIGLNPADDAVSLKAWLLSITNGSAELAHGAVSAASTMLSKISESENSPFANGHATVKPTKLMEYLIRLVTPPGGTVLDPFTGSGSTGVAAVNLGFAFIGIEREAEYVDIAKSRIAHHNEA